MINFITLFLATDQIPAWTTSCFDQVIGRFEKERAIDWFCLVCVSPFKTQWGGTNEQTKRSQSLSLHRSIWPVKNEMDGGQKSTLRKKKVSGKKWDRAPLISGADLSEKRKSNGKEDKGKGRGEVSHTLPPQKNRKTKKSYNEKPHCLQMHWGGKFPSSECVLRLRQLWKFIRQAFELTFVQNRHR